MKSIRSILSGIFIGSGLIVGLHLLHAQETATPVQNGAISTVDWSSASDLQVLLQAVEQLPTVPATNAPRNGTFYSALHAPGTREPWPPMPLNARQTPLWNLGDNIFLMSDLNVDYSVAPISTQTAGGTMTTTEDGLAPPGSGGTNGYTPQYNFSIPDYGTNLWIRLDGIVSNNMVGIVSNTLPDVYYEFQSVSDLLQTNWGTGGAVYGSELTNWTAFGVAMSSPSNLFLRVRSWQDDGSGLPIWWQQLYFGVTTGVDPYANPAGDGWNNLQKLQNGMNPNQFYTPPAPQGLTAFYNANSSTATISWQPSPGAVTGYTVEKDDGFTWQTTDFNFSTGTLSFVDDLAADPPDPLAGDILAVSYTIVAHYGTNADSAQGGPVPLEQTSLSANFIAGPQGSAYLAVPSIPAGTVTLRVSRIDEATSFWGDYSQNTNFDIPASASTNGLYLIPSSWCVMPPDIHSNAAAYDWFVQTVNSNGVPNATGSIYRGYTFWFDQNRGWLVPPYFDGRAQLKQNLIFQLRAAMVDFPLVYAVVNTNNHDIYNFANPVDYGYAGFYQLDEDPGDPFYYEDVGEFNVFWPFENNNRYRNLVFSTTNLDTSGRITTGAGGNYILNYIPSMGSFGGGLYLLNSPTYWFQAPATNGAVIPAVLATNQTRWLSSYALDSTTYYLPEIGVTNDTGAGTYSMYTSARNSYGLPFLSANIGYNGGTMTLYAGNYTTQGGYFYPETAQPQFQTVEYDFWDPNTDALPGMANFSTTNTSRLMIAGVGDPNFQVESYAKLAVLNAYSGVYGYLGQYFDHAYRITNGIATTNTTGVLSPYGQFFATEPGPVALVTMPDTDTGARGTSTVYCVSLALDKNHDGNMDLGFNSADATLPSSPFFFWINNNYDRWKYDSADGVYYMDDILTNGSPDFDVNDFFGHRVIPTTRDLEDFARLWICGVTSNLLAALPANSTVTLNWDDVGNPNPITPTIDIFQAVDADGGVGYLTNSVTATNQINPVYAPYVGRLGPGQSIQLNANLFGSAWRGDHFIWCGVTSGSGSLNLTFADGSGNVLAESSVHIQLKDIKDMYERWTVGDNPNVAPMSVATNAANDLPDPMKPPFHYTPSQDTNTPYILFVHGWNMATWEKDRFAETAFKRLYWQGYQGRFGSFRWPTHTGITTFDQSESNAWKSGAGLLNLLTDLNTESPGNIYLMAHSMGGVVAGEALRQAGANFPVNTYVAMQTAIASHAYDPTMPIRSLGFRDSGTPDRHAEYWTNGAPCYFNGVAGAASYVNFFNTNDYALGYWTLDQDTKPALNYSFEFGSHYYRNIPVQTELFFPGDTYEIFSFITEARCYALGAQPGVSGSFATARQVELDTSPYNFGSEHLYHSIQFRSDNTQSTLFWSKLLSTMKLK